MDALFEKLDRLSSPIGTLLDKALARVAPRTTAEAACAFTYACKVPGCGTPHGYCGSRCGTGSLAQYLYYQGYSFSCAGCGTSSICYKLVGCQC